MARATASPHKHRSEEDVEFSKGRIPTVCVDHCFLGSEEDQEYAHSSPFLVMYDKDTEWISAIAVPSKSTQPWAVAHTTNVLREPGYDGVKICFKSDKVKELQQLYREVPTARISPTMAISTPTRQSKANGDMERSVRTWAGKSKTLKCHLEYEINKSIDPKHPILQWAAWWAAQVINRWAVRRRGRTAFEYAKGHKTKSPVACFGEQLLWRKRKGGSLNKLDSEWAEGIFLGMTGQTPEILVGTENGIFTSSDVRGLPDGPGRWSAKMVENMRTTFEEYIDPSAAAPDAISVHVPENPIDPNSLPTAAAAIQSTRIMRLLPEDFRLCGYTGGCPGCVQLQRKTGISRIHTEVCRRRVEAWFGDSSEGKQRKDKTAQRK